MSECTKREPVVFGAEEGVSGQCLGAHCTTRLPSAATGGALGMTELRVPPGAETPLHLHRNEDEILHVLEGDFRFWCGEWERSAGAGATVVLPRGVVHAFRNVGKAPGRMLEIAAPGGFEKFFEQCGAQRPDTTQAERLALGAKYGVEIVGRLPAATPEPEAGEAC